MPTARILWITMGLLALACGIAGIVLPLVPTTPFLLLAAYAFARSSPRLHDWIVSHPRFGPPIEDWNSRGVVGRSAKRAALAMMAIALAGSYLWGVAPHILFVQAAVMVAVGAFLLTRPSGDDS
jgi:uncharacterized membrane protein YbaN (DUF454 family)